MKRSFILSCLGLALAINANSMMAKTITINPASSSYWNLDGSTGKKNEGGTYFARIETKSDPMVTIICQNGAGGSHKFINNIGIDGNWFDLYTAKSGLQPQYSITVPDGYAITAMSATIKTVNNQLATTWYIRGSFYASSAAGKSIDISGFKVRELLLECNTPDGNQAIPTLWEDFTITVEETDEIDEDLFASLDFFRVFDNSVSPVPYRIPAIGKNKDGDLIAVCDYRYSGSDIGIVQNGRLDLKYRIMNGKSGEWGEEMTLQAALGSGSSNIAFGDPCIVGDRESNRMMVTSCCGNVSFPAGTHTRHLGWARFYSEDGGKTWSEFEEISEQVFDLLDQRANGQIRSFFIGSGKITQSRKIKNGDYYRLYCAALVKDHDGVNVNYVLYSDDFGLNWNLLGDVNDCPVPSGADEPKAEELPDGSVLVSSRISGGRFYNIFKYDDIATGAGKWGKCIASTSSNNGLRASSNACNGEVMLVPVVRKSDGEEMFVLLQSVPFGPFGRNNVGINYKVLESPEDYDSSENIAADWDGAFQVTNTDSGYSTMCFDKDYDIAFFMEENLSNGGYDMVYCKITMEEITDGKFSVNTEALSETGIKDVVIGNGTSIDFNSPVNVYNLDGKKIHSNFMIDDAASLQDGIYIINQGGKSLKWLKN